MDRSSSQIATDLAFARPRQAGEAGVALEEALQVVDSVAQRTRQIGTRRALGATKGSGCR